MSQHPATLPLESVRDLMAPGAPLPFRVIDAQGRLLLAQGQCVQDVRQLKALLERGACVVYADVEVVRQAREQSGGSSSSAAPSTRKLTWFDRWERHIWDIDDALRQVGRDPAAAPLLAQLVQQQMALVTSQPDAALFTLLRQDGKRMALYALSHARHTALVVQLTTELLGWAADRVHCAVAVALTMNASIVELQARMADQAEPPSKKQMDQIRGHPAKSAEMLRASGITDAEWLTGVEDHHEHKGAGGYPRGIDAPGELACVVRAADVYAAKLSPRALRPALPPQAAARQLFQEDPGSSVAAALIRAVGVYPPGEWVRLKSGEGGIVVRRASAGGSAGGSVAGSVGAGAAVGAEVAVLLTAAGKAVTSGLRRDTAQAEFAIAGAMVNRSAVPRVLPEQLFGLIYA